MNAEKHGIDFEQAKALWDDPRLVEWQTRSDDEPRFCVVARVDDVFWTAVITYREDRIRLISVRRSREGEIRTYEG